MDRDRDQTDLGVRKSAYMFIVHAFAETSRKEKQARVRNLARAAVVPTSASPRVEPSL